jgi:hypothetical protein
LEPGFYGKLTPAEEQLQRMRVAYVWITAWPPARIVHWLIVVAIALFAGRRQSLLIALAIVGVATMPLSYLLLDRMKWALIPQIQPMRALLFTALAMQFLAAVAAVKSKRWWQAAAWFFAAYILTVQPVLTEPWAWKPVAVVAVLALATAVRPICALAAFVAIPLAAGIVNYPNLHTPDLTQLSTWAASSTPKDAIFLFPDARRNVDPGIFRADAQRAIYVDWKGGGQINYIKGFGEDWWFRWNQTMLARPTKALLPKYNGLGIEYIVVRPNNRLPIPALYENPSYLVYSTH